MVEDFGSLATQWTLGGVKVLGIGLIVILLVVGAIIFSIWMYKRKKWNLSGTAHLLRNNLNDVYEDKVKGYWDAENGWIVLKRRGYRKVHTRPFDPKKWLVGRDKFHVVQTGPEDFVIARIEFGTMINDATGKEESTMKIIADLGKRKTWKNYTERMGKKAFTLVGWAEAHQFAITLAILIFVMFLGFAILWTRQGSLVSKMCGAAPALIPFIVKRWGKCKVKE